MNDPKVSVIIPAYNQADFLVESVQSVLDQTYSNFEVIVVNDASTDKTDEVIRRLDDPRIKYIMHKENRYAAAARNTGIRAAQGELIAFLDADDIFQPQKLQTQVSYLIDNPDIGLTYCSRFEIDETGRILKIAKAPIEITLSNLVMDFPISPCNALIRKIWFNRAGLFDEAFSYSAEDPDFLRRLALAGCQMSGANRCLYFRRIYTNRRYKNLEGVIADQVQALENTFSNPQCPPDVLHLRDKSFAKIYLICSYLSFFQNSTDIGQDLLRKSISLNPSLLENQAGFFLSYLIHSSIRAGGNHEEILYRIFSQLPSDLQWITEHAKSSVAYGYLLRGAREIIWDRIDQGKGNLNSAVELGSKPDYRFLQIVTQWLLNYESEFGPDAAQVVLERLAYNFRKVSNSRYARRLRGSYFINQAFQDYFSGKYVGVPSTVLEAISYDPSYLFNRGAWSVLLRSIIK
ncbi:glycosyltransferase family 2 protein [Chloroflexota bacterium]